MKRLFILMSFLIFCFGCKKPTENIEEPKEEIPKQEIQSITTNQTSQIGINETKSEPISLTNATKEASKEEIKVPSKKDIQTALKNAGFYDGAIDGKFGPKTIEAIKKFQQENNLKVDGKVGHKTWTVLKKYLTNTSTLQTTQTNAVKD